MHKQLRAFLEANGLPATATEEQAWEHHRKLVSEGIVYNGPEKEEREPATAEKTRESPAPAAPAVTEEQAREMALAAARAERVRVEEIRGLCAHFDVPEDRARALIDGNKNLDEARAAVLEYLKASSQPFGAAATAPAVGLEADEKFRAAAIDGVLMQVGVRKPQPAPGAADFRALSPLGLARNCLERAGVNTAMMSASQIARRALIPHSTSDFPLLLTGIGKETLLAGYTEAPQSWRPLAAVGTATDFRDMYASHLAAVLISKPSGRMGSTKRRMLWRAGRNTGLPALAGYSHIRLRCWLTTNGGCCRASPAVLARLPSGWRPGCFSRP